MYAATCLGLRLLCIFVYSAYVCVEYRSQVSSKGARLQINMSLSVCKHPFYCRARGENCRNSNEYKGIRWMRDWAESPVPAKGEQDPIRQQSRSVFILPKINVCFQLSCMHGCNSRSNPSIRMTLLSSSVARHRKFPLLSMCVCVCVVSQNEDDSFLNRVTTTHPSFESAWLQ